MNTLIYSLKKLLQTGGFYLFLAGLFAYVWVGPGSLPYFGLSLCFALLATAVFVGKESTSWLVRTLYGFCLILCACLIFRSNEFLTFLNLLAIVFAGSLMSLLPKSEESLIPGLVAVAMAPVHATLQAAKARYSYKWSLPKTGLMAETMNREIPIANLFSIGLSLVLLIIIVPLLASANLLFAEWVRAILDWFAQIKIWEWFKFDNAAIWGFRVVFFLVGAVLIPRLVQIAKTGGFYEVGMLSQKPPLFLPKLTVISVLGIFFLSQAKVYFSSSDQLLALGYSHSEYAREIFAQLSVVAGIVLGLLYNDFHAKKSQRWLSYILFLQALFLTAIAFKSVFDYSAYWGLTHKRLWGFTGVFWLTGALLSYMYWFQKMAKPATFVVGLVLLSLGTLVMVNISNFDYLIYHYAKSTTHDGTDYRYLSLLSSDALSYRDQLQVLSVLPQADITAKKLSNWYAAGNSVAFKVRQLQVIYEKFDWRTFNVATFQQYYQVRDLDTETFSKTWRQWYYGQNQQFGTNSESGWNTNR